MKLEDFTRKKEKNKWLTPDYRYEIGCFCLIDYLSLESFVDLNLKTLIFSNAVFQRSAK